MILDMKIVDGVAGSEIRSGTGKYRLFRQPDTVLALVGVCGSHAGISGVRGTMQRPGPAHSSRRNGTTTA